jgi:hypothetical protein
MIFAVKEIQGLDNGRRIGFIPRVAGFFCVLLGVVPLGAQDAGTTSVTNLSVRRLAYYSAANIAQMRIAAPGGDPHSGTFNISSVSSPNYFAGNRPDAERFVFSRSVKNVPTGAFTRRERGD